MSSGELSLIGAVADQMPEDQAALLFAQIQIFNKATRLERETWFYPMRWFRVRRDPCLALEHDAQEEVLAKVTVNLAEDGSRATVDMILVDGQFCGLEYSCPVELLKDASAFRIRSVDGRWGPGESGRRG